MQWQAAKWQFLVDNELSLLFGSFLVATLHSLKTIWTYFEFNYTLQFFGCQSGETKLVKANKKKIFEKKTYVFQYASPLIDNSIMISYYNTHKVTYYEIIFATILSALK